MDHLHVHDKYSITINMQTGYLPYIQLNKSLNNNFIQDKLKCLTKTLEFRALLVYWLHSVNKNTLLQCCYLKQGYCIIHNLQSIRVFFP
jgi:hypothetical protein